MHLVLVDPAFDVPHQCQPSQQLAVVLAFGMTVQLVQPPDLVVQLAFAVNQPFGPHRHQPAVLGPLVVLL